MKIATKLLGAVRDHEGTLNSPTTHATIVARELEIGVCLSPELRQFLLQSNGAYIDEDMRNFFSIEEIDTYQNYRKMNSGRIEIAPKVFVEAQSLVIFCDILIDCPSYWICLDRDSDFFGQVFGEAGLPGWRAAPTYEAFIDLMFSDTDEIYIGLCD